MTFGRSWYRSREGLIGGFAVPGGANISRVEFQDDESREGSYLALGSSDGLSYFISCEGPEPLLVVAPSSSVSFETSIEPIGTGIWEPSLWTMLRSREFQFDTMWDACASDPD